MAIFQDKQQVSDQRLRNVANAVDGRLLENNERNTQQEYLLRQLSDEIIGLREEMKETRSNTHNKFMKTNEDRTRNRRRKVRVSGGKLRNALTQ